MYKTRVSCQDEYEFVSIDELVPDEHLLRLIDKYIDFTFLLEKVRSFYSDDNGRPSDLLILFKMMFIGYIYGIRSERQLEREIKMNMAYRWFLGLKNASEQALLTAVCQNIKKIATYLARLEKVCCNTLG